MLSCSVPSRGSYSLPDGRGPSAKDIVKIGRPRGMGVGNWRSPTDEATVFMLLVDDRELRALVDGEIVRVMLKHHNHRAKRTS